MRENRFKATALAGALALALGACSFPPYDEGLSLGILTASKMDPVGKVGPLPLWYGDLEGLDTAFLLSKSNLIAGDPIEGYLLAIGTYNVRMVAVEYFTNHTLGENRWEGIDNTDPNEFTIAIDVVKDPVYGGGDLIAFVFQDTGTYVISRDLLEPWEGEFNDPLEPLIEAEFGVSMARVIGVTVVPTNSVNYDEVLILWYDDNAREYREARYQTAYPPSPPSPALVPDPVPEVRAAGFKGLPAGTDRGFYGHHAASGRSYLSVYDSGEDRYRTYRWDDSLSVTELAGMERRVDKVLSNGLLFSYGETKGYVYDANGNEVNSFPLGDLYLSCEITVGTTPRLFFTLPTWGQGGNDSDDFLFILVYSIPTSEIDEL